MCDVYLLYKNNTILNYKFVFYKFALGTRLRKYLKIEMMKRMRTLIIVCIAMLFSAGNMFGQDMAEVVEIYNAGGKALGENNYPAAIESFEKALAMLEAMSEESLGEEGKNMITEAKGIVPQIHLRYGKDLVNSKDYDKALTEINKAAEAGEKYGAAEVVSEAKDLVPQVLLAQATALLQDKKGAEAVVGFKKVLELDPNNVDAHFRLGAAEVAAGNETGAIEAFEKAVELGDKNSIPQLANIYLKRAVAANSAKNMQEMFNNAVKADEYSPSGNSKKLAGQAAFQLKKYNDAIKYLEEYVAMSPDARDKNNMIYMIALSYEGRNDTGKACGYFKQLMNDPTYKEVATHKVTVQYKC